MQIPENISWKQLADKVIAVNTSTGEYYTLNGTASLMWLAVDEKKSRDEIVEQIMANYDISDRDAVCQDVDEQLNMWKEEKLITE